jgi:four helix bundle protein
MQDFRKLTVWERSHKLCLDVYRESSGFPPKEIYGVTSQIRRAAASIPTNIAEGCGRSSGPDFARFLQVAMGSACETEYLIILAHDLAYLNDDIYGVVVREVSEVKQMLAALIARVRQTTSEE